MSAAARTRPALDRERLGRVVDHVGAMVAGERPGAALRLDDVAEMVLVALVARRSCAQAIELAEDCATELIVLEDRAREVRATARRLLGMSDRAAELAILATRRAGVLAGSRALAEAEEWAAPVALLPVDVATGEERPTWDEDDDGDPSIEERKGNGR